MADVRGMYELGRSLNQAGDTFGNLSTYAPEGLKQTAVAAGTARAANDLTAQQGIASDLQANQQWQQEAAGRDDFGTAEYANDKVKFLQNAGASPAAITKAQMDAQQATHTGQMQDLTEGYVQKTVEDRVAQKLGMEYYQDNLKSLQAQLVKDGATAQEAADKMTKAAIQAGKNYMNDQGIYVNIDHQTGNIAAIDKDGNTVPLDPDIAAQGYKLLGQTAPWSAMKDVQNESLVSGRALGTTAYAAAGAPTAANPVSMQEAAAALKAVPGVESHYRVLELAAFKDATTARNKAREQGMSASEADAERDAVLATYKPRLDELKSQLDTLHRTAARTGAVQAAAAAPPVPPTPPAPPVPFDPAAAAAQAAAAQAADPRNAHPANLAANALINSQTQQGNPQAVAARAAQLVQNLHLDQEGLNSPEVQTFLNSIDPRSKAAITELLSHQAQVYSQAAGPGIPQ